MTFSFILTGMFVFIMCTRLTYPKSRYRAETAMAEMIVPYFYKQKQEKRMLIKQLYNSPAYIMVNEKEQTLTITIASMSAPRYNEAIRKLCEILNDTETIFPGTNLKLIYKNYAD